MTFATRNRSLLALDGFRVCFCLIRLEWGTSSSLGSNPSGSQLVLKSSPGNLWELFELPRSSDYIGSQNPLYYQNRTPADEIEMMKTQQ